MIYYNGVYEIDFNDPPFILMFMVKNHWIINKLKDTLSDTSSFKKDWILNVSGNLLQNKN